MAAKKAPAKKMAAPAKAAPKKSGNVGSANAAEKRLMDKKAQSNRTDVVGRSGFGETATSNVYKKKGVWTSNAQIAARAAAEEAFRKSLDGAIDAYLKRTKKK